MAALGVSPSLPGPSTPSRRLGEASLEGSRGLSCLSSPRQGAEGLEEAGVGSGEGVKVAGLKLWRAPPLHHGGVWAAGPTGLHIPKRGRARETS